jgi:transglutaminase-like putative cysteine protease
MSPNPRPLKTQKRDNLLPIVLGIYFLVAAFSAFSFGRSLPSGQSQTQPDQWYIIKIGGNAVGYLHENLQRLPGRAPGDKGEILRTNSEMKVVLNRLGSRVEISFVSATDESADGRLLAVQSEMMASNQKTTSGAVIKPGVIELRSEAGGKSYIRTLNYTGELYGPEGIRQLSVPRLKNPGDKVAVQTFIAEATLVSRLERSAISEETIHLGSENIPTIKVEENIAGVAVKRTVWLDTLGTAVKQEEPGPFGITEAMRTDRATALAAAAGGELPEEMYKSSIVRTNIRLPRARSIDRLRLRLTHKNPGLGWPDLNAPNQKVLDQTDKTMVLEIKRPQPAKDASFPVAVTDANRAFLLPNVYIQSDDAEIQHLARELVAGEKDIFSAALILRRWVAENMKFDLGIAFAPSTEIFRDRRGTCVGYATLLATMSRAAGIPSRVVMGYVDALGMFGGHAWAEILVGKEWIPLDAAIVNDGAADATRFYFVASSLAEGLGDLALGAAQQIFGQVGIEIMEYEIAKKTHIVPEGAKPYEAAGNRYENPWLGIKIDKPKDFKFGSLDAIWPDPSVVEVEGPAGVKAVLEQLTIYPWQDTEKAIEDILEKLVPEGRVEKSKAGGHQVYFTDSARELKSAAAISRGLDIFVWIVEGKNAPKLARRIAASFKFEPF